MNNNNNQSASSSNSIHIVTPTTTSRTGKQRSVFSKKASGVANIVGIIASTSSSSLASNASTTTTTQKIPQQRSNQLKDDINNNTTIKDDVNTYCYTKEFDDEKLEDMKDDELFQKLREIIKGEQAEESMLQAKVTDRIASSINEQYTIEYIQEWKELNLFHYKKMHQLGCDTKDNMTELSTLIYDLMAFKDIILEYYTVLPYKLLQDIVLLSSKFYRKQSDLFWNLSEFMTYVFYFENGNPKQAADISDLDINYDFFSMRQLMFQYHQQEELLKKSSSQLEDLKKHAETIITKRYLQMEKEVEFLRGENKFLKENTANVEKQTLKLYNELTDAFIRNQESSVSEIETERSSSDESENIKNSKYNEELRELGYKLDAELKGAFQKINSLKEVLDNSLTQSNTLKSTDAKVFQQLQSVSVQLGTLSKKFDGKIQDSIQNVSKEIDKALEKKVKVAKRDMAQWKLFNKDATFKIQLKEQLMKTREDLLSIKEENDAKEESRDERLDGKILIVDDSLKQLILQVAPNEFSRIPEENQVRGNNTDTKRPIRLLQQTLNEIRYEKNGEKTVKQSYLKKFTSTVSLAIDSSKSAIKRVSSSVFDDQSPQTPTDEETNNQYISTNQSNSEEESAIAFPPPVRVDEMLKNIEKITTNIQEDNKSFHLYQKKLQETEKKYSNRIKELERQVISLQEELVSKKNTKSTSSKPLTKVVNSVSTVNKLKSGIENSPNLLSSPNPILSPSPTTLGNIQNLFATPKSSTTPEEMKTFQVSSPKVVDKTFQTTSSSSSTINNNSTGSNVGILRSYGSKTNITSTVDTPSTSKNVSFHFPSNNCSNSSTTTCNTSVITNNPSNMCDSGNSAENNQASNLEAAVEDKRKCENSLKKGNLSNTIEASDNRTKSNSQMTTPSKGTESMNVYESVITPHKPQSRNDLDDGIVIPSPLTQVVILSNGFLNGDAASVHMENNPLVLQLSNRTNNIAQSNLNKQHHENNQGNISENDLEFIQSKNDPQKPDDIKECLTAQSLSKSPQISSPSTRRRPEDNVALYSRSSTPISRAESSSPNGTRRKIKRTNSRKREMEEEPIIIAPNEYGITTEEVHALPIITSLLLEDPQLPDKVSKKEKSTNLPYLFQNNNEETCKI